MEPRKYCVVCGNIYRNELRTCPDDGAQLVLEAEQGERLRLGHVLGNYRLIRKLGEGGVGTVYEGEHIRLGRKMALKVLHPETASAEVIVRFFNEARAVNQIRHPSIVDVEDFVTAESGEHYLIMELLVGEDLRTVATREGVMDPKRVVMIGEQIAGALGAIHRAGIVHRDIKPDNIYLCRRPDGTEIAKLIDFGIAKFLDSGEGMTREGMTLGTPEYMAPEQILSSGKPGPSADLYSLGMLMYECVSGAPAFTATTTAAILRGHISEPAVPPSHRRGEPVPPVLEAAILKCLAKDPKNRFATGEDLANALRAERAVELITPRYKGRRRSRALQMVPAFLMAAAAAVLHFLPKPEKQAHAEVAAAPVKTPAPAPARVEALVEKPVEKPAAPPTPPAPKTLDVALTSSPDGAQLSMNGEVLGSAPQLVSIPMSSTPIELVAKFEDGTEVVQKIVPDRPLPQVAFVKPAPKASQPVAVKKPVTRPTKAGSAKKGASTTPSAGTMTGDGRDGTMDPFK